jgi:putative solute:sodium symporter small subunit
MAEAAPERARREPESTRRARGYWRANLRLQVTLLVIWAIFGYLLAILLADPLNDVSFGGFPLGFWFAQQGAIYVFVLLIFIYAVTMDRVDHEYGVQEEELGGARKRAERRMQRRLTGEAPAAQAETGEPTGEATRRDDS